MALPDPDEIDIAVIWFLAARAMAAAHDDAIRQDDAIAGLYAQAILSISEDACLAAKSPDRIGTRSLVDCLAGIRRLDREVAEKIVVGVLMISYGDHRMHPLEVRWASMLASAAQLSQEDFQRCCASSRVMAAMMRPGAEVDAP